MTGLPRLVVGIDWSLAAAGVAAGVTGLGMVGVQVMKSSPPAVETLDTRLARLRSQAGRIIEFAHQRGALATVGRPLFVIEAPIYGMPQKGEGGKSWDRAGGWWLLLHILAKEGRIVEVSPTTLKMYWTTSGGASKATMKAASVARFPGLVVTDDNAADAIALVCAGARWLGSPLEPEQSRVYPPALEAVRWPTTEEANRQ